MRSLKFLLLTLLIAADCAGNVLLRGSWRNTISARAWIERERTGWGMARRWIDWGALCPAFNDLDHCQRQAEREIKYGSVWAALWAGFKAKE